MKYTFPFYYEIEVDGQVITNDALLLEYSKKEITEIIHFISDNQYFDCELCNMPGTKYDEVIEFINEEVGRFIRKNKIKGNEIKFYTQPFLPLELIQLFPDELKAKLNTAKIFEWYEVTTMDELMACIPQVEEEAPEKKQYEEGTFMKTLAIRQPWAQLIAMGIKDIECRDSMPTKCRKIFVAASGTKVPWNDLPLYVQELIEELVAAGKMPAYKDLPTKCIIGHVDIVKASFDDVDSIWGRDWDGMKYTLRNAEMLDEPLYGLNKATPYFYNVEGYSENNLPASHKVDLTGIKMPE